MTGPSGDGSGWVGWCLAEPLLPQTYCHCQTWAPRNEHCDPLATSAGGNGEGSDPVPSQPCSPSSTRYLLCLVSLPPMSCQETSRQGCGKSELFLSLVFLLPGERLSVGLNSWPPELDILDACSGPAPSFRGCCRCEDSKERLNPSPQLAARPGPSGAAWVWVGCQCRV